jgi:hypothetical protein
MPAFYDFVEINLLLLETFPRMRLTTVTREFKKFIKDTDQIDVVMSRKHA